VAKSITASVITLRVHSPVEPDPTTSMKSCRRVRNARGNGGAKTARSIIGFTRPFCCL
jgi:hypothetical protein